jgi:hypothetical protein
MRVYDLKCEEDVVVECGWFVCTVLAGNHVR